MGENRPLLYSYWHSSCTWRVRIAMQYKGIPYDMKFVNLYSDKKEQHAPEYKALNPIGHVPALVIDGHTLIESLSILHYLEETRPEKPLLPKDPLHRAKVREISEMIASAIQPFQNLSALHYLEEEKRQEYARHWITRGFRAIEKLLIASSGKYCVGDEITMADCCLVPQVYGASMRFSMDLSEFPNIVRVNAALEDHPAFRAAHPLVQPDCPTIKNQPKTNVC